MTTYPLEYYLCLKGTPHIKIVDLNAWEVRETGRENANATFKTNMTPTRNFISRFIEASPARALEMLKGISTGAAKWEQNGSALVFPEPERIAIAVENSDQHLLLTLTYGNEDWIELGEEEALALMRGERV